MSTDEESYRPVQGWQFVNRSAFTVRHGGHTWVVDVDFFDWDERIRLYRDGALVDEQRGRVRFDLDDGSAITARTATYGMRYVRLITPDGVTHDVPPADGTAEAWRARVHAEHPTASRAVAAASWTVLVAAIVTQVPRLLDVLGVWIDGVPSFALDLPGPLNTALQVGGVLAAIDRGLRLRHNRWIDD
ncbi:hypothetical protein Bcav_0698 [Beutenbergia cavernae DSM 12333]|uniref:Uncharacterized protein n=1 Tax=Beutenbergia cavernae (strain ATCC BAA-8 / DSM 12333 / CCUG 43141 / JCM 11478 / NBRC 16432 / NCIMB 13614 / HKI 0122) TaxID=471853 RepID=C5BYK1_BEUC1|nr:hypothetical protein [Beutenbergia cavernae]ACQ78959.1 hypothetical protein Bcav_0698 [Beutenbergia cavernae DSM 12333]